MIKNVLSVDLESFVHGEFLAENRREKDNGFIKTSTEYLLDLFETYNTKTTFFIVSEIYDWYPDLIEKIEKKGHEIAYHTHIHTILKDKNTFLNQLELSKKFLKKFKPIGFRAPRMFILKEHLSILSDFNFSYDSSVYGVYKNQMKYLGLKEVPVSCLSFIPKRRIKINFPQNLTIKLISQSFPYGSGLFLGLLQKKLQYFIDASNHRNESAILFVHPWQFFNYPNKKSIKNISSKLLYMPKVNNAVEYLLSKNKFYPLRDLI